MMDNVSAMDSSVEIIVMMNVSLKNWNTSCRFELPIVFRMPISFALCEACAVVRLMKLIQPRDSKNNAMANNS